MLFGRASKGLTKLQEIGKIETKTGEDFLQFTLDLFNSSTDEAVNYVVEDKKEEQDKK